MFRFYFNCQRWQATMEQWIYASHCLPIEELHRINQYAYKDDAKLTLIGQLLVRYLLNRSFPSSSKAIAVQRTTRQRPFVETNPPFDFNLSHHQHVVCIAGTFDGRIGCDTISYEKKELRKEILRKKFTRNERDLIAENPMNFHRLWCLKESYVKYLGVGIGYELSKLDFRLRSKDFRSKRLLTDTELNPPDASLRFDEELLSENQLITLSLSKSNPVRPFSQLTLEQIFASCRPVHDHQELCFHSWKLYEKKLEKLL